VVVVAEELEAGAELEGEVEAGGVVDGDVAGGDKEASVADDEGLEGVVRREVNALA
jgi:hypothetical protein